MKNNENFDWIDSDQKEILGLLNKLPSSSAHWSSLPSGEMGMHKNFTDNIKSDITDVRKRMKNLSVIPNNQYSRDGKPDYYNTNHRKTSGAEISPAGNQEVLRT